EEDPSPDEPPEPLAPLDAPPFDDPLPPLDAPGSVGSVVVPPAPSDEAVRESQAAKIDMPPIDARMRSERSAAMMSTARCIRRALLARPCACPYLAAAIGSPGVAATTTPRAR